MTDPAAEAAKRAWAEFQKFRNSDSFSVLVTTTLMDSAAREALKPIRELHRPVDIAATRCPEECETHEDECPLDAKVPVCRECFSVEERADAYFSERTGWDLAAGWPCATAKLIYREDEL